MSQANIHLREMEVYDLFIGFLYSASAGAVVKVYFDYNEILANYQMLAVGALVLVYIAFSWTSVNAVRRQLRVTTGAGEEFSYGENLAKFFFEVLMIFFLATASVLLLEAVYQKAVGDPNVRHFIFTQRGAGLPKIGVAEAFGLYAITAGLWNLIVLWAMNSAHVLQLFGSVVRGDFTEQQEVSRYVKGWIARVTEGYETAKTTLRNMHNATAVAPLSKEAHQWLLESIKLCTKIAGIRITTQLLGVHVLLINLLVGARLLLPSAFLREYVQWMRAEWYWLALAVLCAFFSFFFNFLKLGACLLLGCIIITVGIATPVAAVMTLIGLHVLASSALQWPAATSASTTP